MTLEEDWQVVVEEAKHYRANRNATAGSPPFVGENSSTGVFLHFRDFRGELATSTILYDSGTPCSLTEALSLWSESRQLLIAAIQTLANQLRLEIVP